MLRDRLKLLDSELFCHRYIGLNVERNARLFFGFNLKKRKCFKVYIYRAINKISHHSNAFKNLVDKLWAKYFSLRMILGKVDIPYFELVLTTKCTLNCASCNNMMQYFSKNNQYVCSFEAIKESLETLLSKVDSVG